MQVIHAGPNDIYTWALCIDWHIRRCNVKDCTNRPDAIISGAAPDVPTFGCCEEHYQAIAAGHFDCTLIFDDFDAFTPKKEEDGPTEVQS